MMYTVALEIVSPCFCTREMWQELPIVRLQQPKLEAWHSGDDCLISATCDNCGHEVAGILSIGYRANLELWYAVDFPGYIAAARDYELRSKNL